MCASPNLQDIFKVIGSNKFYVDVFEYKASGVADNWLYFIIIPQGVSSYDSIVTVSIRAEYSNASLLLSWR